MKRLVLLVLILAGVAGIAAPAHCGVQFLAHYNKSLDADASLAGRPKAEAKDVRLTAGGMGVPFTNSAPSPECADVGYTAPAPKGAGLLYDAGNIDVRQGTIQMWVKTSWDWDNPKRERVDQDRCFFSVPLAGGIYNSLNLYFACGPGFNYSPHVAFYIHDGKRDYMCCARVGAEAPTPFRWQRDTWHYFVLTWTPRRMHLYADGKQLAEREFDVPMSLPIPEGPIIIGNRHRDLARPANALIDEVRILDFPLDGPETAFAPPTAELPETILGQAIAAGGPSTAYHPEIRRYFATRASEPPIVDGDLSDPAWRKVPAAGGFLSLEGQRLPVTEQTEAKACYDDTHLYLAVRCHEDAVKALEAKAKAAGDMQVFGDDTVEVFLSADASGMPCLQLGTNAASTATGLFYGPNRQRDRAWKGSYRTAVRKGAREWTLEIAFPFADFTHTPPRAGDRWRWNVCRDRRAGVGLQYSTMNFITSAFLSPEEYGDLLFAGEPSRPAVVEERDLNRDFLAHARRDAGDFAGQVRRELALIARVPAAAKRAAGLTEREERLRAMAGRLQALAAPKAQAGLNEWNRALLDLKALRRDLNEFAVRAGALGPAASVAITPALKPGIVKKPGYYLMASRELAAAVDALSGTVAGVWEKRTGRRLVSCSYDIYQAETRTRDWRSDRRMDKVTSAKATADALDLVCTNPDLPGVQIRKRYTFAAVGKEPRILCRRVEIGGATKELMLLKFSSNTVFEPAFREKSYYDRVFPIGTIGDPRSQAWAREVKEPLMQRAWFTATEGRAQFGLVDPTTHTGLAEYLYKLNDRWVYPQGLAQSYWTPFGWEMGYGGTFVRPAHPTGSGRVGEWGNGRPVARPTAQSSEENARPFTRPLSHSPTLPLSHSPTLPLRIAFETRLHLFHGDHLAYHREYLALPEHAAVMRDWTPHPEAVRVRAPGPGMVVSVAHAPYGTAAFGAANASARPNEILLGLQGSYDPRWGIWPAADGEELVQLDAAGRETGRVPCKQLKQAFADLHRLYPRYRDGFYNFIMDIHTSAPIYKRHPEWVLKNRNGRESAGVYGTGYVQANWTPAFVADLTAKLLRTMDYYDQDLLYLDFGPGTILVDWERGEVVQLHVYADFLKRLHAELAKRGKLLWLNSFTGQFYYDIGYHESDGAAHQLLGQWRNGAAINLARKLYTRPGTICVPLYWHGGDMFVNQGTANEDRYRNLVLASGLTATGCWLDPYEKHFPAAKGGADWAAVFQYHAPVQFATAELARSQFAEIGLSPAHWRDFDSDYETFTLKMGPAFLLNVISHKKEAGNAAFTVDPKRMGLAPGKPLFNWQFVLRDPKRYPKQAPAPPDWDRLFERSEVRVLDVPAGRLSLVLNDLIPDRVRLTAVTQVPAVLSSVAGKATQLLLPENLGCRLRGAADTAGRVVRLTAEMEQPGEALLWFPEVWGEADLTVGGKPTAAEPVLYGSERFLKVPLPAGKSAVVAQAK